jgi:hypothetical protein
VSIPIQWQKSPRPSRRLGRPAVPHEIELKTGREFDLMKSVKRCARRDPFWRLTAKMLVSTASVLGAVSLARAQGEVDFENFNNSLIYTNSIHNGPATGLMSGPPGVVNPFQPGTYVFALFAALTNQTTVDATLSGWVLVTADGVNTATAGLMNGNDDSNGPGATLTGPWGSGEVANFVVVGWSANIGTTWGTASAWWNNGNPISGPSGYFVISSVARDVVIGGGLYPIPTIFGPTPEYEIQGFTLNLYTLPPDVSDTGCATGLSGTGATLNGTSNPNGTPAGAWFQWGTSTAYGNTTPVVRLGNGMTNVSVSAVLTGLIPSVTYHYRLVTTNSVGTTYGSDRAFSTPPGTLTVTSLADSGPGTLRDMISAASCGQTITFVAGLSGTVVLTTAIGIGRDMAIIGPGAANLTISGSNSTTVLSVGATASISGLTITGGFEGGFPVGGAGVGNGGNLTLSNCVITGNSDQGWGARGGAIYNYGTLRLVGCTISSNTAIGRIGANGVNASSGVPAGDGYPGSSALGGAIYNSGTLAALDCTFTANIAQGGNGGNGGNGGSFGPGGKGGNAGDGLGGAIETSGSCTLINCTIDGNTVTLGTGGTGGSQVGPPTHAPNGTNGVALGGGIHISTGGSVMLLNTIVAQDTGTSPDTSGTFTSQGHNLIGATNGSSGWVASDFKGSIVSPLNPLIGPLQNNGGPTLTIALLMGSPAIDAGDDAVLGPPTNLTIDQRGYPRKSGLHADIGAFELQPATLSIRQTGNNVLLSWLTDAAGFTLEYATNLPATSWTSNSSPPAIVNGQYTVTNAISSRAKFYRLRK